jgi:hypothetical protein
MEKETGAPDDKAPTKGQSSFEKLEAKNTSLPREIWGYLGKNKKWWLLPIMGTLLAFGLLALVANSAAMPFIYTFF